MGFSLWTSRVNLSARCQVLESSRFGSLSTGKPFVTRTGGCKFEPQLSHAKDLKNAIDILSFIPISINQRVGCLMGLLCVQTNGELQALGPPTQDPH